MPTSQLEYYHAFYRDTVSHHPDNGVYQNHFPVTLRGGGELYLPFRRLNDDLGIALLMLTQIPNSILKNLSLRVSHDLQQMASDQKITIDTTAGIAKLGYLLAQPVSENLGQEEWVPIDTGNKNWYPEKEAEANKSKSMTSNGVTKSMVIDPFNADRVDRKTVVLVDDVISSGSSFATAVLELRKNGAANIVGACVFTEGTGWRDKLASVGVDPNCVVSLGELPIFRPLSDGSYQRR